MLNKIQTAQFTQQTRPPIPHNNKPPIPNKQTTHTQQTSPKNNFAIFSVFCENSKNARQHGGYDLPGPPIEVSTSHDANESFFSIYAPP